MTLVPRPAYVMKQEMLRIPLFGALTRQAGMIAWIEPAAPGRCAA